MNRNIFNLTTNVVVPSPPTTRSSPDSSNSSIVIANKQPNNNNRSVKNTNSENNNGSISRFTNFFSNITPLFTKSKKLKNFLNPIPIKTETGTIPATATIVTPTSPRIAVTARALPKGLKKNFYDEPFVNQSYKHRMDIVKKSSKQEKLALISKYGNKVKQQPRQKSPPLIVKSKNREFVENGKEQNKQTDATINKTTEAKSTSIQIIDEEKISDTSENEVKLVASKLLSSIDNEMKNINKKSRKQSYRMSFSNLSTVKEENETDDLSYFYQQKYMNKTIGRASDDLWKSNVQYLKMYQGNDNIKKVNQIVLNKNNTFTPIQQPEQTKQQLGDYLLRNKNGSIGRNNKLITEYLNQEQQKQPQLKQIQLNSSFISNNTVKLYQAVQLQEAHKLLQQKLTKTSPTQINKQQPPLPPSITTANSTNKQVTIAPKLVYLRTKTPKPVLKPPKTTTTTTTTTTINSYLYTPSQTTETETNAQTQTFKSDFSKLNELDLNKFDGNQKLYQINTPNTKPSNDTYYTYEIDKSTNNNNTSLTQVSDNNKKPESSDLYKNIYNCNEKSDEYNYDYISYLNGNFDATEKSNSSTILNNKSTKTADKSYNYDYDDYYNNYYNNKSNTDDNYYFKELYKNSENYYNNIGTTDANVLSTPPSSNILF